MTDFALLSFLVNVAYFLIAGGAAVGLLKWFDWTLCASFGEARRKMADDPTALAIYYGARFFAVFYLAAAFAG
ncbi:MAG: hypothetical protein KF765_12320 [Parvibaculaceae bacterium]|nr:hypothetical protein [Parvibaculaceae bacterium]